MRSIASRRVLPSALLALLLVLLAACGDDGDSSDSDDGGTEETTATTEESEDAEGDDEGAAADVFDRDACELLTDEQAAEILGDSVTKESEPGDATISQPAGCTWAGPDATVDFTDPQPTAITAFLGDRQIYDNTQNLAQMDDSYEELDGIGDEAYAGDGEGGVLVGDVAVTVSPIGVNVNDPATHDLIVDLLGLLAANV